MKRQFLSVLILMVILGAIGTVAQASSDSATSFVDVSPSHWAKEEIDFLSGREIITGYDDGTFRVNNSITRAEAATMIMRYFGWSMTDPEDPGYPDLKPGSHWAYDDIASVYHLDIFTPTGHYKPQQAVTRAEMADMLVNTFDLFSIKGTKFTDLDRDHWAYKSINTLAGSHITTGYTDGTFRPDAPVTRAEFAVFMSRAMDRSFRVQDSRPTVDGIIYDLEINEAIVQLEDPLILQNEWFAPVELFERLGFTAQTPSSSKVVLTSSEGFDIELEAGQQVVWVGETSVDVQDPLMKVDDSYYIKAHGILNALGTPLVFYPDDFIIRLEAPRITAHDIIVQLPESALDVLHTAQPYWHWVKRDRDHLELMRQRGQASLDQLVKEMAELMDAYYHVKDEVVEVQGLRYFSNEVSGKLDALARGLEARYLLLAEPASYNYPEIAKSTRTSLRSDIYSSIYTVSDHTFMNIAENSERLYNEIASNSELPFHLFEGLTVHSIPFTILETEPNGRKNAYAGLASGSTSMLVVNAGISTFFHEFGHNWDHKFGDQEEYLNIRGKSGYVPPTNEWEDRIHENFAEDFAVTFLPAAYGEGAHKASFGMPTDAEKTAIRDFVLSRSQTVSTTTEAVTLNGMSFVPDAIYSADGQLHVKGTTGHHLFATIENVETGVSKTIDLSKDSSTVDQIISLDQKGIYEVQIGAIRTMVVFR